MEPNFWPFVCTLKSQRIYAKFNIALTDPSISFPASANSVTDSSHDTNGTTANIDTVEMTIYNPSPHLSREDRRLLGLLFKLISEHLTAKPEAANFESDEVPLSNKEAGELADLIDNLTQDSNFIRKVDFIERIANLSNHDERELGKIYTLGREILGHGNIMSSMRWNEYLIRIGIRSPANYGGKPIQKMAFNHFLDMERILLQALGLSPIDANKLVRIIADLRPDNDATLVGYSVIREGTIVGIFKTLLSREKIQDRIKKLLRYKALASATIILANSSVLFTTRDWSATGTYSMLAGAMVAVAQSSIDD